MPRFNTALFTLDPSWNNNYVEPEYLAQLNAMNGKRVIVLDYIPVLEYWVLELTDSNKALENLSKSDDKFYAFGSELSDFKEED